MKKAFVLLFLAAIVFFAGCIADTSTELKFKNDVVTIENYFVSNVAPYEGGEANIQFEIHNNGDRTIPYLEVHFFDIPGFAVVENSLKCDPIGNPVGNKCVFVGDNAIESLDVRSITINLNSREDISSPTPHTVSFAVRYTYFGSRDVFVPVIDGDTRKQPLTKLRLNEPSVGPIVVEIDPGIEREIMTGEGTVKEHWAVGGRNPLPFLTKFKLKHVGSLAEKVSDVSISASSLRLQINGLDIAGTCDFCDDDSGCNPTLGGIKTSIDDVVFTDPKVFYKISPVSEFSTLKDAPVGYNLISTKSAAVPHNTFICSFKPTLNQPEYSARISAFFAYKYEFIKSQSFVVQPLPS